MGGNARVQLGRERIALPSSCHSRNDGKNQSVWNKKPLKNTTFGQSYYLAFSWKEKKGQMREVKKEKHI